VREKEEMRKEGSDEPEERGEGESGESG